MVMADAAAEATTTAVAMVVVVVFVLPPLLLQLLPLLLLLLLLLLNMGGVGVCGWSHIFGDNGVRRSGDEVLVSASDSPSLLHLESTFLRFNLRSWKRLILSSSLYGPRLSVIIPDSERKNRESIFSSIYNYKRK